MGGGARVTLPRGCPGLARDQLLSSSHPCSCCLCASCTASRTATPSTTPLQHPAGLYLPAVVHCDGLPHSFPQVCLPSRARTAPGVHVSFER